MGNIQTKRAKDKGLRLMQLGSKAYKTEQYQDAIEFLTRALEFLPHSHHKGPLACTQERTSCLDFLVKLHWRVGNLDQALAHAKETLTIKQETAPNSNALAKSLSDIGCLCYERGEYTKALYLLQGALAIRETVVPGSLSVAVSCTNLALVLTKLGQRNAALEQHERACQIKEERAPNSVSLARTYISLSHNSADYQQALEFLEKARTIAYSIRPVPTSLIASLDVNRGNLLMAAGKNDRAILCYEKAIAKEERIAPDSLIMASMLDQLAKACEERGLQPEARAARGKSIGIRCRKAPSILDHAVLKQ